MPLGSRGRRGAGVIAVLAGLAATTVGCETPPARASGIDAPVVTLPVAKPLDEPVWSDNKSVLLGLTADGRVEKVDPSVPPDAGAQARSSLSAKLRDVGKNLSASPTGDNLVFVPQPELGTVAVVRVSDLRKARTLLIGPEPQYVSQDSGSKYMLAISRDGSMVTGVDLKHGAQKVTSTLVGAGKDAEVEAGKRGRRIDFYVFGSKGETYYKGDPHYVKFIGKKSIPAETATSDLVKSSRLYIARKDTNRLVAVDEKRSLHGLEVVGSATLDEPVKEIGLDRRRIYAATEHKLVVLRTKSFEGYQHGVIPVLTRIDYRSRLDDPALRHAKLAGLAVGPDRVYLSFSGVPDVVSIAKPSM
jgi:hypothetical protein